MVNSLQAENGREKKLKNREKVGDAEQNENHTKGQSQQAGDFLNSLSVKNNNRFSYHDRVYNSGTHIIYHYKW